MTDAIPEELPDFLVRSLPSHTLWEWLSTPAHKSLQQRIVQGFRPGPGTLQQPVARARLTSHLQTTQDDFESLLNLWVDTEPKVLEAVRTQPDDATLIAQLPVLQAFHSAEALVLALLHEEREAVLEAFTEIGEARREYHESESSDSSPNFEALQKQLQRAEERIEKHRQKAREAREAARQTEKKLREQLREQESAARAALRQARQAELQRELLAAKLEEAEKSRDRAERKARSILAENEENQMQVKTLRRQLHRLQQLNEETRSRLTALDEELQSQNAKLAELSRTEPTPEKDEEEKNTESHHKLSALRRTPRPSITPPDAEKIVTAVERGDERFVATFRRSLALLREQNSEACSRLLAEIRALSRYSERVLTKATTRALVDASNVARYDGPGRGKMEYLHAMREELQRFNFFPILFVADASLPYHIDEADEFRELVRTGEFLISASGQEADEILARQARETGAYVITNDRNFHRHLAPVFVPMRIGFQIFEGTVVLDEFYDD